MPFSKNPKAHFMPKMAIAAANNNSLAFSITNIISTNNLSTTTTTTFMPNINHFQENIDDSMMEFPSEYVNNDFVAKMPQDCMFHPTTENYFMIFIFSIIFCLSVIGNSIVVVVILQQRSMRSVTNLYLLNLALSDLLLSVVCMPPTLVSSLVYCWVFGDILCKLLAYLQPVVVTASAYTLAAIALERYYAICRPLHSRVWHTRAHGLFMISLVWFVSVLANVFMLFMYEERTYNINGLNCSPKFEPVVHFTYQIYMTIVLLLIPLFTMTVLYGNVIRTLHYGIKMDIAALELLECGSGGDKSTNTRRKAPLWKQASSTTTNGEQSIRSTHSGQSAIVKQRLIRMLIVIVVIFFCCWTPSYIWWLLLMAHDTFGTFNIWNSKLNTLITVLTYLSSCTNPITYCFLNNKFRNALFRTFGCRSGLGSGRSNLQKAMMMNNNQQNEINIIPQMQANCGGKGTPPRVGNDRSSICSDANNNDLGKGDKKNTNCCIQMLRNMKLVLANSTTKNIRR